jgi:antitoxin VapB
MPITIKNEEVEQLVRELAREEQTSLTEAIHAALKLQLAQLRGKRRQPILKETLLSISARCSALPDLDNRAADEILGYDETGVSRDGC